MHNLNNNGFRILSLPKDLSKLTIVVVGVGRGGTSMCAGTLSKLGVFMGDRAPSPTFEDLDIYEFLAVNNWSKIENIIQKYNTAHKTWGVKLPALNACLNKTHQILRNPFYIFVFRDIVAVANRASISHRADFIESLKDSQNNYSKILEFIYDKNPDGIALSYDKAISDKENFVENIKGTLKLNSSNETTQRALQFIQRDPNEYIETTSFRGEVGYLDIASTNRIAGWATTDNEAPATLSIWVNDEFKEKIEATVFREDLLEKQIHTTGHCSFDYSPKFNLSYGDLVSVRFSSSNKELRGSPTQIK